MPRRRENLEKWRNWFHDTMLLTEGGFVLGDPKNKFLYHKETVVEYWGEKDDCGYSLREEDGVVYNNYVRELYERVHQREMADPLRLPLHFARGLMAKADGVCVNWCAFAIKRCFPGQKKSDFQVLPKFQDLDELVPFTWPKVFPSTCDVNTIPVNFPNISSLESFSYLYISLRSLVVEFPPMPVL